ncbi:APC family permease [Ignatzschineria sp. LJL83]
MERNSSLDRNKFTKSLSLWSVVLFGLAFMALTTVFSTFGIASSISQGMIVGAYILAMIVMLFTAYSYSVLAKRYPMTGSAYSYVQKVIHPNAGFLVGWAVMMDYLFIPMVNFMLFGIFFHDAFPVIPQWVFIMTLLVIVTVINLRGVKVAVTANLIIVVASILFAILFTVMSINSVHSGVGTGILANMDPIIHFEVENPWKYIIAGASLLCFSFLGFDSVTAFAEEVENPQKMIPRAIFLVTFIGGVIFIAVSYFAYQVWPDYTTFPDLDAASGSVIKVVGGNLLYAIFLTIFALGNVGSALASQASGSRILFAMGRDGQLPNRIFGMLHPKYKTPIFNILLIGIISISATFLSLGLVASIINFGAFIAFIMVNISVMVLFFKEKNRSLKAIFLLFLLPLIGAVLDIWLFINLDSYSLLLGFIWFSIGIIYLLFLTKGFKKVVPTMPALESI